jgi:hypothetical protein
MRLPPPVGLAARPVASCPVLSNDVLLECLHVVHKYSVQLASIRVLFGGLDCNRVAAGSRSSESEQVGRRDFGLTGVCSAGSRVHEV